MSTDSPKSAKMEKKCLFNFSIFRCMKNPKIKMCKIVHGVQLGQTHITGE